MAQSPVAVPRTGAKILWTAIAVAAAFGAYFCMYAFRKPFTAAAFAEPVVFGIDFKTILVTAQVFGYMLSKFIGIKVVAEMPPGRRAWAILVLIGLAQTALLLFGLIPAPWSAVCLFLNGLPLGMVFGLVLGFLEGRRTTEFLTAGLCASFILADGVMKSVGTRLLDWGYAPEWMPFWAGLFVSPFLVLCVMTLMVIPTPTQDEVADRGERATMDAQDRRGMLLRYAAGLSVLVGVYLLVTIVRSIRADFAPELWRGLGASSVVAETYTYSEFWVMLGVVAACGATVLLRDNRFAFFASLATCGIGFVLITIALIGLAVDFVEPFTFMVLVGLGLYLPYVAIHTTVFERLLAMTRDRGTICFLMSVADAFGYLGYAAVMLGKQLVVSRTDILGYFIGAAWIASIGGMCGLIFVWQYFARRASTMEAAPPPAAETRFMEAKP